MRGAIAVGEPKKREKSSGAQDSRRSHRASSIRQRRIGQRILMRTLITIILIACAFCAGFALRAQTALMESWGIPLSASEESSSSNPLGASSYETVGARVSNVESLLAQFSLDTVNIQEATYSTLDDLMKATGDSYAMYYNPDVYDNYIKETTERTYSGIGVLFSDYNGRAYVADVFEGSEAESKGVQQGDFVESIDGDSSVEWSMTEVVNALSKDEGSTVTISWMRPSSLDAATGEEFTTELVCKTYEKKNLTTDMAGKVGVIKLRQITQNAVELVQKAVEDLTKKGATSFVLDLRDNPGGYLTQAVDIASLFVPSGVLVEIQTVDGTSSKTASGLTITDAPLVVLVNKYTSAAAEVLAAALQDNQRAEVIGRTTMGKGSVQVVRELSFGGAIRYTAAYYLTPKGSKIDGVGITPQVAIASGKKSGSGDVQLTTAIDAARSLTKE